MDLERQLATLRYWMDVEGLTAPDAGREERERYQSCVHVVDERLPWLEQRPGAGPRVHYVRFGIMRRREYEDVLRATLDARADAPVDGGRRQVFGPLTYLGVFAVEDDGRSLSFDPQEHLAAFGPYFARLRGGEVEAYAAAMQRRFGELQEELLAEPARRVDLDLLLLGDLAFCSTPLTLPHPRMHQRAFVLRPLLDLAPDIELPRLGRAADLLAQVADQKIEPYLRPASAG